VSIAVASPENSPATPEIRLARDKGVLLVTLDRPRALNALSLDMIRTLDAALIAAAADPEIACVVIEGEGGRAFCAGGDIRSVGQALRGGDGLGYGIAMFRAEYTLNHRIRSFAKPFIALVDGIVMGGGVGVSIHGSHRVVSERVAFAMPETGIGLFPDVGMTYLLPRCPGEIGLYVGMSGAKLAAPDCKAIGFATHIVPSGRFPELRQALIAGALRTADEVDAVLAEFATRFGPTELWRRRPAIDRCFGHDTVEAIFAALAEDGSEWARTLLTGLESRSPTSLKLTLRAFRAGRALDFATCLATEFRMSVHCLAGHDLVEGVRALLLDKDMTPHWRPSTLAAVSTDQLDAYFAPLTVPELVLAAA
jgi:enoyl-CoA hydratase